MIGWKTMGHFLGQWYHVKWWHNFVQKLWKKFSQMRKKWLQKRSSGISSTWISLEVICTQCEFFKKLKLHHSFRHINSKLNSKPNDYLYLWWICIFISLGVVFIRRKQRFFKLRLTHIRILNTGKLNFVSHKLSRLTWPWKSFR